jgi:hypothetical protein
MREDKMMRKNIARVALLVGLVWAASACERTLTEINENPNAPTDVTASFLLPQAIRGGVENAMYGALYQSHTGIWPQHLVELQYPDEEQGEVRASRMNAYFQNLYIGSLKDIQTVINKGMETGTPNHQAVGMIWKSWIFHQVTDLWGDVPYSEALRGEQEGGVLPAYDTQESIYTDLLASLTSAASMLAPADTGFGAGDLIYGNDFVLWERFANSLRMRLAMRLSEVSPATAQTEFVAAYNAGGFQSNADNATLEWAGNPYENPLYENYLGRDDHGISETMVDTLLSFVDPRLPLYAEPAETDGVYRGHQNGRDDLPPAMSLGDFSRIGNFWRADGAATPALIMTYSEVLFLQAEAAERGWITANPATLYTAAIQANMDQYDGMGGAVPTDAEIATYLAQPRVVYDPANGLNQIYLQKWISLYMCGSEAWFDWRRTDVPNLLAGPHYPFSRLPVRFTYPTDEQSLNSANLEAAIARQGGLLITDLVWWDVR